MSQKKLELAIWVPMPPSVNKLYVQTRGGGKALTKAAKDYENKIKQLISRNLHYLAEFPISLIQTYGIDLDVAFESVINAGWFEFYTRGKNKGERKAKTLFKKID